MEIVEIQKDLFDFVGSDVFFVHCISADFKLGAGIARTFDNKFNMRKRLFHMYGIDNPDVYIGKALAVGNVFNLVTKSKYWQKPTYYALTAAIQSLRAQVATAGIKKLAMPKIGCGLDRLDWVKVKTILEEVFKEDDITIYVCYI